MSPFFGYVKGNGDGDDSVDHVKKVTRRLN